MATSEFLPYQDADGDGLNDACKDIETVPEPKYCPKCIPNPLATAPDWRTKGLYEPFLNEKVCNYQIAISTTYKNTGYEAGMTEGEATEALNEIYKEFEDQVIIALLEVYSKDISDGTKDFVRENIEYTDYFLDARLKSRLKLLYSVPFAVIDAIEAAAGEEDDGEEGDIVVTYVASDIEPMLMKIRKGLHLYNRYLKVLRMRDGSNILFLGDNRIFNLGDYGDFLGMVGDSLIGDVFSELDTFLNKHGYNMPRGEISDLRLFLGRDRVTEITLAFTDEFDLKNIKFFTEGCGDKQIFMSGILSDLKSSQAWKDKTAVAYFARLKEMDTGLSARVPEPWTDFIIKHTYPEVYLSNTLAYYEQTGLSCVREALANEAKQFGQDIFDEAFSIGDAIAYKFHEQLCKASLGEALDEEIKLGVIYDPSAPEGEKKTNIGAMALEQAFGELEVSEQPFAALCANAIAFKAIGGKAHWAFDGLNAGIDDIKLCGLYDALSETIRCLLGGLTLEQALGKIVESALRAMSVNSVGELFVGLPKEKQDELNALVFERLEAGDVLVEGSSGQEISDFIETGEVSPNSDLRVDDLDAWKDDWTPPWEWDSNPEDKESPNRTLAQQFDKAGSDLNTQNVLEAYIAALIGVYSDDLLELVDELNKFPGAQLISNLIIAIDCPRPPASFFNPPLMDWFQDLELPICRNVEDIRFPRLVNPFGWYANYKDILNILFEAIKFAAQQALLKVLMALIIKVCELIGNAICNALALYGDLLSSVPDLLTGRDTLKNLIRDSICGDGVDEQVVDSTIIDMMANLGVGGAALADTDLAIQFSEDMSASLTQAEMMSAFLGEPSDSMLIIIESLIEFEYPSYREAIPNKRAIGSFFKNIGNLMPAGFKAQMRDMLSDIPPGDETPANPSICIDPEKLEKFCTLRKQVLQGRASPKQLSALCDNVQALEDLGDLTAVLQKGLPKYLEDNMPPLVSDPGCDNGLVPYDAPTNIEAAASVLGGDLEILKADYSTDMIGNGPGEDNWGMINMMLSDTMGNPLTAHYRFAANRANYVDFYTKFDLDMGGFLESGGNVAALFGSLLSKKLENQRGSFPTKVAVYLQDLMSMAAGSAAVNINNDKVDDYSWQKTIEELGFRSSNIVLAAAVAGTAGIAAAAVVGGGNIDLLAIPDLGYNIDIQNVVIGGNVEEIEFTRKARKGSPDITLSFEDNAKGLKATGECPYSYGFDIKCYFGDLAENESGAIVNRKDDNLRILIEERFNFGADLDVSIDSLFNPGLDAGGEPTSAREARKAKRQDQIVTSLKCEFLSVDDTFFDNPDMIELLEGYPIFNSTFDLDRLQWYTPQTLLFKEILNGVNDINLETRDLKEIRQNITQEMLRRIMADVAGDETSWNYGAKFDDLTQEDFDYGVNEGGEFIPYSDVERDGRKLTNDDMVLGISRMQYLVETEEREGENRVLYLDPMKFGGNYVNPPLYIKPAKAEGWLGMVDVLFPELSPCKPQLSDLVDFGEIQDMIGQLYPNIPEDERLKSDPDCVKELPYNRIMDRSAKAAMAGLITAAIRIYVSAHMIKSLPTFAKFAPRFPMVYSSAYSSYIVENMQKQFKDAQPPLWEAFNTFKDEEFWYGFLEQCVQYYGYRVDSGDIPDPPSEVLQALFRLNDMQEEYEYQYRDDLVDAKKLGEAEFFQTLKSYRAEKNLEAVRLTESDAKLVMKELVTEQINFMSKKLLTNLKRLELEPEVKDLGYYFLETMTIGGEELTLNNALLPNGKFSIFYSDLPTVPVEKNDEVSEPYYTNGNQFVIAEDNDNSGFGLGEEYVGHYHVHQNEDDGEIVYMAGEYHSDEEPHDVLKPIAGIISIPFGDVGDIETDLGDIEATDLGDIGTTQRPSSEKPFIIEKYVSINGTRMTSSKAAEEIGSNEDLKKLISEVYPGTMSLVEDESGNKTLEGELGVRYGLVLSIAVGGSKYEVAFSEIDALDLELNKFVGLERDGKLLLCLINHLKNDNIFRLITRYILPMPKLVSIVAIYNDMAMLPSIGELTVDDGETFQRDIRFDEVSKPGIFADITQNDDGTISAELETIGPDGAWASLKDRKGGLGVREWDNWDQQILKNSTLRIKKLFKAYYNSRDFTPSDIAKAAGGPGEIFLKRLREAIRPAPGRQFVPWWQRRRLRTNPLDANNELCEK